MIIVLLYFTSFFIIHLLFRSSYKGRILYDKNGYMELFLCFLLLFVFFGFRDLPILNDTNHYYRSQVLLLNNTDFQKTFFYIDEDSEWEYGFQILQSVIGHVMPDPYMIIMVSALVLVVGTLYYLRTFTKNVALGVFFLLTIGVLTEQFSTMRQSWALVFMYISLVCSMQNCHKKGFAWLILALLFHNSAVVLFPFYVLSMLKLTKRSLLYGIIGGGLLILLMSPILFLLGMNDHIYVTESSDRGGVAAASVLNTMFQFAIIITYVYLYIKYRLPLPHNTIVWGVILGLIFGIMSIFVQVFNRFFVYFGIFYVLLILHFVKNAPKFYRNSILIVLSTVTILRCVIVLTYRNEWKHLVPYAFFDFSKGVQYIDFGY